MGQVVVTWALPVSLTWPSFCSLDAETTAVAWPNLAKASVTGRSRELAAPKGGSESEEPASGTGME